MFELASTLGAKNDLTALLADLGPMPFSQDLGFLDWDVRSGNITFDHTWAGLFGLPHSVSCGNAGDWEKSVHAQDLPEVLERLNAHLAGETPHFELEYRLADGGEKIHSMRTCGVTVARNSQGRPTRVIMVSRGILLK